MPVPPIWTLTAAAGATAAMAGGLARVTRPTLSPTAAAKTMARVGAVAKDVMAKPYVDPSGFRRRQMCAPSVLLVGAKRGEHGPG